MTGLPVKLAREFWRCHTPTVRERPGALACVYFEEEPGGARQPPPSFDHLISLHQQRGRYLDPERLGGI